MERMKSRLSTLWIFATLNYIYCDVLSLMDSHLLKGYLAGSVNGMAISQGFLLAAAVLVEIPIAMVLLSRVLNHRANRVTNLIAAAFTTVVQVATLFVGTPAPYYVFFSAFEVAATAAIFVLAWRTREQSAVGLTRPKEVAA